MNLALYTAGEEELEVQQQQQQADIAVVGGGDGVSPASAGGADAGTSRSRPSSGNPATEPFGWLCNMTVVRLPKPEGGCVLYSPILDQDQSVDGVLRELKAHDLLPVRIIVAPSPQHHLALTAYQDELPDTVVYLCGMASRQMPPLTKKRRDLRFDAEICATDAGAAVLRAPSGRSAAAESAPPGPGGEAPTSSGTTTGVAPEVVAAWGLLCTVCDVSVVDDQRTGEVVLLHRPTKTLIVSDLLYKSTSTPDLAGPGSSTNHYSTPEWFAKGQQELFYAKPGDNSGGLLPSYRTHPRMRTIDLAGTRRSLDHLLSWTIDHALACHTDPMAGDEAKALIRRAWGWVWSELGCDLPMPDGVVHTAIRCMPCIGSLCSPPWTSGKHELTISEYLPAVLPAKPGLRHEKEGGAGGC